MNGRQNDSQGRELLRAIAGGAVQAGAAFAVTEVLKRVLQRKSAELIATAMYVSAPGWMPVALGALTVFSLAALISDLCGEDG